MHIGVDATCWHNTRGYGRHARALLRTLVERDASNRYTFFSDVADPAEPMPPTVDIHLLHTDNPTALAASADGHRSVRDMWRMSRALSTPDLDVLLFPTVYSYVPVWSPAKKVVIIHDVIAETFPQLTIPNRTARLFWNTKVTLGRWQADAIVTVSDYSKQCIVEHFKIAPESVFVVGEAGDPVFHVLDDPTPTPGLQTLGITEGRRYAVYVGGFGPHKNLEALVAAFADLAVQDAFSDVQLVLVGAYKKEVFYSYADTIRRQIEARGIEDRVVFTGFLPDDALVVLLNLATVLVLPSLMEGFGLPAVEAAACGCPVIATTASPLPGLLGEGGLYIDPGDTCALTQALQRVLGSASLRQQMRRSGLAAAGALTWEAAARQMMNVLDHLATPEALSAQPA